MPASGRPSRPGQSVQSHTRSNRVRYSGTFSNSHLQSRSNARPVTRSPAFNPASNAPRSLTPETVRRDGRLAVDQVLRPRLRPVSGNPAASRTRQRVGASRREDRATNGAGVHARCLGVSRTPVTPLKRPPAAQERRAGRRRHSKCGPAQRFAQWPTDRTSTRQRRLSVPRS